VFVTGTHENHSLASRPRRTSERNVGGVVNSFHRILQVNASVPADSSVKFTERVVVSPEPGLIRTGVTFREIGKRFRLRVDLVAFLSCLEETLCLSERVHGTLEVLVRHS
jgi:hypothetical protein